MANYSSESEGILDNTDSSDNFHIVPSTDEQDSQDREEQEENEMEPESTEIEEQPPRPPNPILVFIGNAIKLMLLPFCKIFFAPTAQRTFVKTTVMAVTLSYIIATSMFAYIIFYNRYIPPITHVQPIWFHYTGLQGPRATVDIATQNAVPLRHEQVYDVSVELKVPTSDINFEIGNFMIDVQLQTKNGSTLIRSSRPAILRYQSRAQRILRVFSKAIPLLIGLSEESQVIQTKLIDNFTATKNNPVSQVEVTLSDPRIQIYDARLLILAKFHGLRYYMYFHRIMTGFTFILMFTIIEFIFAVLAWKGFGERLWSKLYQSFKDQAGMDGVVVPPSDIGDGQLESETSSDKSDSA